MNKFVLTAMALVLTGEYLAEIGLPAILNYAPELCAIVAAICALVVATRSGLPALRPAYITVLGLLVLHLLFGIVANDVQVGTVLVGSRIYLRAMPFFLLALLVPPTEQQLKSQLVLLCIIGVLQLPIAIQQRLATMARDTTAAKYLYTGDWTYGTLMNPAFLSIFLICIATAVFIAYLRKSIGIRTTIVLLIALLIPTMINETKATLVLIPIAFIVAAAAHDAPNRTKHTAIAVVVIALFLAAFVPIYDYFMVPRWSYGILDFLTG